MRRTTPASITRRFRRLRLEQLEPRLLLTTWTVDALGDGTATDASIMLREALEAANQNVQVGDAQPGSATETDQIRFAPGLFAGGPATITLSGTELTIRDDVAITGPGAELLTIDANGASRVISVESGTTAALSGLTISGGSSSTSYYGGGISNEGTLTVTGSTISGNSATGEYAADGGGIYNDGALTVTGSTISGNSATGTEYSTGGGIWNGWDGTLTVTASTISGNSATATRTDYSAGGGIFNRGTSTLTNSIVALNHTLSSSDFWGSLTPQSGFNLIGIDPLFVRPPSAGADGTWGTADDDYGDLHLTDRSPAINLGSDAMIPIGLTRDLDGNPRIFGEHVDVGAYEFQGDPAPGREAPSTVVSTTGDSFDLYDGRISLREAVFYAAPRETITFAGGLGGQEIILDGAPLFLDRPLTIDASGLESLTINADQKSRVLTAAADGTELIALTITGGSSAGDGGGMGNFGTLTVTNSIISGNSAKGDGGGIYNGGVLTVTDSTISGNSSGPFADVDGGGGIQNALGGTMTVTGSTISGNSAWLYGGGIQNAWGTMTVTDSTISGNSAMAFGGGIINWGTMTVTNSTISGNSSEEYGGGISNQDSDGTLTLINSIVALNDASLSGPNIDGTLTPESGFNLIGGDPHFVRNADPDHGDYGDFRLRADSPAIDAGNTALAVGPDGSPLAFDIRGQGFPRVRGGAVDIGAFEYQPPRDLDGSGRIDDGDLNLLLSSMGAAGGPADLTGDGIVDQHDVRILLLRFGDPVGQGLSAQSGERKAKSGTGKAESGRAYATLLPLPVYGPVQYRAFRAARRGRGILPVGSRSAGRRPAPHYTGETPALRAERVVEMLASDVARRRRLRRVPRRGAPAARPDAAAVDAALVDWGADHARRQRSRLAGADFD